MMSTDDCTTIESPCLCGKGIIAVEQCTPDHPWARASQTSYSASLNCDTCSVTYQIVQRSSNSMPTMVLKTELEAQREARSACVAAERKLLASEPVQAVRAMIIREIDSQPSRAAAHRALQKFHLAHEVYATYSKRPYGGAEATKYSSGSAIAEIGIEHGLFSKEDLPLINRELNEIKKLRAAEQSPKPVKTGAHWMSH